MVGRYSDSFAINWLVIHRLEFFPSKHDMRSPFPRKIASTSRQNRGYAARTLKTDLGRLAKTANLGMSRIVQALTPPTQLRLDAAYNSSWTLDIKIARRLKWSKDCNKAFKTGPRQIATFYKAELRPI